MNVKRMLYLQAIQVTQNKYARFLNECTLLDKINAESIYKTQNILSINQINAQIKLTEIWKSLNVQNYPTQWEIKLNPNLNTRSANKIRLEENGWSKIPSSTFMNDAARVWNKN